MGFKPGRLNAFSLVGMTHDSVRFEWFSKKAIQVIRDVQIVNLVLDKVEPGTCDGLRKSGMNE